MHTIPIRYSDSSNREVTADSFSFGVIDGTKRLQDSYRLRYQVYCKERGFLSSADYPRGLETDVYDDHSIHAGAMYHNGEIGGTVRLVLPSKRGLPLQSCCRFFPEYAYLADATRARLMGYAEVSRLAVSRACRNRIGPGCYLSAANDGENAVSTSRNERQMARDIDLDTMQGIVMGLYKCIYHESKRRGVTHWIVAMERSLAVILRRMEFVFEPVGPEIDYYGPVTPYLAEVAEVEKRVLRRRPTLFWSMMTGLEASLVPKI